LNDFGWHRYNLFGESWDIYIKANIKELSNTKMPARLFIFALYFLVIICPLATAAQVSNTKDHWTRLESESELTVDVPSNFNSFVDSEGFSRGSSNNYREIYQYKDLRSVASYRDGVAVMVERYKTTKNKRALVFLLQDVSLNNAQTEDFSIGNFIGRKAVKEIQNSTFISLYLASDNYIYFIAAGARKADSPVLLRFFNSIRLEGKQLIGQNSQSEEPANAVVSLANLQSSPLEVEIIKKAESEKNKDNSVKESAALASTGQQATKDSTLPIQNENTKTDVKPMIVLRTVRAEYTEAARRRAVQGTVVFRLSLSADGKITSIKVVRGLSEGLTEQAVKAARRFLFLPEVKDGVGVAVNKTMEFGFNVY
jgi:TonB family protein